MGTKREARIARQNEKKLEHQEKSVRLVEAVIAEQTPRLASDPASPHAPRIAGDPSQSIMQMRMEYQMFQDADRDGAWTWGQSRNWCLNDREPHAACLIRSTMIQMSALNWHEISAQMTGGYERHRKHHEQSFDSLCDEAQKRWIEIGREEDELFRFRTTGKSRIWGFRIGHVFHVVWWDAEHQIYPVA